VIAIGADDVGRYIAETSISARHDVALVDADAHAAQGRRRKVSTTRSS
jgi:Trk K+ transport system NAD-binding subunit